MMSREIDARDYVQKVMQQRNSAGQQCRSAVGFVRKNENEKACFRGYVIDNAYFIQKGTYQIFPKSNFYLINYDDEITDSE